MGAPGRGRDGAGLPAPAPAGAARRRAHRLREGLRTPAALKNTLVLLLTGAAGYVDAASYLMLDRVFTANMTGNTVLLGLALARGEAGSIFHTLVALGGFLAGGAGGAWIAHRGPRAGAWPRGVTIALGVEFGLLVLLAVERSTIIALQIVLAALAMGIQSAAARQLDILGVATTFVTGTLTSLVSLIARHGVLASASGHGKRLLAGVWAVYVAGAMAAGTATRVMPDMALLLPAAIVAVVVVIATARFWRA